MGICRSTCAHGQDLEYYDGYRVKVGCDPERTQAWLSERRGAERRLTAVLCGVSFSCA